MKRIYVLTATGMLLFGLVAAAFPQEQTKENQTKKTPSSSQGQKAEESGKDIEQQKKIAVARVNRTDITMNDLLIEMNIIAPRFIKDPGQRTPETDKKVKETALNILIFRELAVQEAVRRGIKIKPDVIAAEKSQIKKNLGSEDNYRKYLEKMSYTEDALSKQIEKDKLFEAIISKEVFQKVKSTDAAAIEKRKEQWEKSLKKKAKIEILLPKVEKEMLENMHKGNRQ